MDDRTPRHPSANALEAFGLGKLDDAAAEVVLTHLSACPDCREKVTAQSGDSFLAHLRAARSAADGTPVPDRPLPSLGRGKKPDEPPPQPPPGLPKELADNPNYRVLRELGRGGMGVVYLAHDPMMDRKVVLKVMGAAYLERPETRERFLTEIRAAAKLDHPNVVKAHAALQLGPV
jgi:serine/threonine protein kinase